MSLDSNDKIIKTCFAFTFGCHSSSVYIGHKSETSLLFSAWVQVLFVSTLVTGTHFKLGEGGH